MKEWRNEYFDRVEDVSLTISELIDVLKGFPCDMPVVGTYEGIYGDIKNPFTKSITRGRDTAECLVFDVESGGS